MSEQRTAPLAVALLLAGLALPVYAAEEVPAQSQVRSVESRAQEYVQPDPDIPTPEDVSGYLGTVANPQQRRIEQQLWKLFGQGDYPAVRRAIAEHKRSDPAWRPPAWLETELRRAEARAQISAAKGRPQQMLALYRRYPDLFSCREYYHLWQLADAQRELGRLSSMQSVHRQMLSKCRAPKTLLTTLDRISASEGPAAALEGVATVEARGIRLPAREVAERRYGWAISLAVALREQGRLDEAAAVLADIEPAVIERQDLGAARLVAWNYYQRDELASASDWFARIVDWSGEDEDRLHWLRSQWNGGDKAAVIAWLQQNTLEDGTARLWSADILRGEAAEQFNAGAPREAVTLLDTALAYNEPEPADSSALRGWAELKLYRYEQAHQAFAEAYRQAPENGAAEGLLLTAFEGGDWQALIAFAEREEGPLLAAEEEHELALQLAGGELTRDDVVVEEGHLRLIPDTRSLFTRFAQSTEGLPGYTWGRIDSDLDGNSSLSFIVNQGIDLAHLSSDTVLNAYLEFRSIDNPWQALSEDAEGALGIELQHAPFRLGLEHLPEAWRFGDVSGSATNAYMSWYHDWYRYLRRRRGRRGNDNPLNVDAYAGSTYGRIVHNLDGGDGTSILGYVRHGVDWFTFNEDITFHTYAAYRFRFRTWERQWYDAHGPAIGAELQRGPLVLGADYTWEMSPQQGTTTGRFGLYLTWYYNWNLKEY